MPLALKDLHATRRGDDPNWVHKCKNGKIAHTQFGLVPCLPAHFCVSPQRPVAGPPRERVNTCFVYLQPFCVTLDSKTNH